MKLYVYVLEAKNLACQNPYIKLKLGKFKSKSRVVKNTGNNLIWNEEFAFIVQDLEQEIVISVLEQGMFPGTDLVGRVRIRVGSVASEKDQIVRPTWFSLEKCKNSKGNSKEYGKILLALSLHGKDPEVPSEDALQESSKIKENEGQEIISQSRRILEGKNMMKSIAGRLEKIFSKNDESNKNSDEYSEQSSTVSEYEESNEDSSSSSNFEEALEKMKSLSSEKEMPSNLQGGVLLDRAFALSPKDLNLFLFSPNTQFSKDLAELQGTTDIQEGPWIWKSDDVPSLMRVVSYTNAASKLVKATKATEEQTYLKADGREFAIYVNVSTPDVPYGSTFTVELLYTIVPGPHGSSDEETSRLVISWGIKFSQSTMMKGMIERGARQGIKESFDQFANLLSENLKTVDSVDMSDKDQILANMPTEQQSDLKSAIGYFWNFTVVSAVFVSLYVFVHILLCEPGEIQGLEFNGLDLPDSVGEVITGVILALLLERLFDMVSHFVQARFQKGSDHGIKSQGDGWVLTVALIEGANLVSLDPASLPDPYVVFTCNGKTKTSSVKLQTIDPQWNEILEFDASEEPPSVLDVEVFDFDGPFEHSVSLGHAEINFLKNTSMELADIWVPLEGKIAQTSQSKLHLRIFLDNNNGVETIRDYLTKMEKEVGKKLNPRSPHRNSMFQKTFGLPPDEFLISDFSCSLKRKIPVQGRLFLSARILGFYSNLFGYKTKFFFLWEDIDEVQEVSPSLSSVGSPQLVIILRKGRGLDAKQGAKTQDEEGRLHFYFMSFVSFTAASRTITALWRTRTLTPDQKAQIAEEQLEEGEEEEGGGKCVSVGEAESCLVVEDATMCKVYSAELPVKGLPDSIGGLESLEELHLSSNLLESLPESIGMLLNLKILDVSGNKLLTLPNSICHCRSLVELDVSFNRLTYLPTNIGHELVNLVRLSVHLNKIRSLPTSVGEMRSLRSLDMHFNELRSLPSSIGRLTNLENLNLGSNFSDLTELPNSIGNLTNLKELDLNNNQIHALPDTFGLLHNLAKLNLDENPLTVPPMEVVRDGIGAVKGFMAKRWLGILEEEQRRSMLEVNEERPQGWLNRSTSWLNNVVSGVSEYIGSPRSSGPSYLDEAR